MKYHILFKTKPNDYATVSLYRDQWKYLDSVNTKEELDVILNKKIHLADYRVIHGIELEWEEEYETKTSTHIETILKSRKLKA